MSRTAIGIFASVCVVAGAGGAYLILNEDAPEPEPVAAVQTQDQGPEAPALEPPRQTARRDAHSAQATSTPPVSKSAPTLSVSKPTVPKTATVTRDPAGYQERAPDDAQASLPEAPVIEEPPFVPEPEPEAAAAVEMAPFEPWTQGEPEYEELVVSAESVVGLRIETALTSERARVEDPVVAQVDRDVRVGDRVAIPEGAKAYGSVTLVERGGRLRDRARLGVRFTSIALTDGTRLAIETDAIYREGEAPGGESAAKIGGGAIGGAIIGGILGGAKGAVIGGTAGAGAGTTAVLAGGRNAATLPAGTPLTLRLREPVSVVVEK